MSMRHACVLADSVSLKGTLLSGYAIDMHGAVAALGCDILIERVPGYALNVMSMFSNFMYAFAYYTILRLNTEQDWKRSTVCSLKNSGCVIRTSSNNVLRRRTPGQIIYLHRGASRQKTSAQG